MAIWGTGSLAGGLAYGSRNWKSAVEGRAMICLALFGAMLVLLAAARASSSWPLVCLGIPLPPWRPVRRVASGLANFLEHTPLGE